MSNFGSQRTGTVWLDVGYGLWTVAWRRAEQRDAVGSGDDATGPMLVVDASALYDLLAPTNHADAVRAVLATDDDQAAPHLIDAEVANVGTVHERTGKLDTSAARLIIADLSRWGGRRWAHQPLLERVWELRHNVRSCDALYVALAERLDATLVTSDIRLSNAPGVRCSILVPT